MTTQTRYEKFDPAMIGKVVTLTVVEVESLKLVYGVTATLEGYSTNSSGAVYAHMNGVNKTMALTNPGQKLFIDVYRGE